MPKRFKFVFIPADLAEPLQQWELDMPEGQEVECLIDRLKASSPRPSWQHAWPATASLPAVV